MLVLRFADVQRPAPLSLHSMCKAHYKCQVIIFIIIKNEIVLRNTINRQPAPIGRMIAVPP